MRNSHGEGRAQVIPRQETVDVIGSSSRTGFSSLGYGLLTYFYQQLRPNATIATLRRRPCGGKTMKARQSAMRMCPFQFHLIDRFNKNIILAVGYTINYMAPPDPSR